MTFVSPMFRRSLSAAVFCLAAAWSFGRIAIPEARASSPRTPSVSISCTAGPEGDSSCAGQCNTFCPDAGTTEGWGGLWVCDASFTPVCAPVAGGGHSCGFRCAPVPEGSIYRCEYACASETQNRKGTRVCRNSGDTAPCDGDCNLTCGVGNCQSSSIRCAIGPPPDSMTPAAASTSTGATGGAGSGGAGRSTPTGITNPIGVSSIQGLFSKIIRAGIGLAGSFALAVFVWGGILWMTARGDTNQVKKAKSVLTQALIGLLLIFFSYTIISAFLQAFTTTARLG